ncbi:phosphoribosylamine--glycine ligase [uncultured Microscilla sp.]|uniref:phosphoribosylamine--glycine ligase n=1 Tax=uncultured Microscilla sp. TaxID=432653 RepID=UPI00260BA6EA|nr:phosphoribosylamine--glycine ligase [uncultured Microscilla sp.]
MNILILGSGGREHAFAWKIAQSKRYDKLFVAPGNAGTAQIATNVSIAVDDFEAIGRYALEQQIDLILVGPEAPLVKGIKNYFADSPKLLHVKVIGPDKRGAMLEGSKDFSKNFMAKYGIPTAQSQTFTKDTLNEGLAYLETQSLPIVLKADGLAAGKGVIISETLEHAQATLKEMLMEAKFGDASSKVVIEQFLKGIEMSAFILSDGESYCVLPEAKDYKRIGEQDTGLNTGGMGAVSPVPFAKGDFMQKVEEKVIQPTVEGLKAEGISYTGFIFFGLMNVDGEPYVIEYNARMGDPETEVVMPRIGSDFVQMLQATAEQKLKDFVIETDPRTAATVMLVSGGYPESYEKGKKMSGFDEADEVILFHAGTKTNEQEEVVTNGGRVISLTGFGDDIPQALSKCKAAAEKIDFEGKYYRKDIGLDLMSEA